MIVLVRMLLRCGAKVQVPKSKKRYMITFSTMLLIVLNEEREANKHRAQLGGHYSCQQKDDQ